MWSMHDVGWGWWFVMSIGMVAFWALVVYAIAILVRGGERSSTAVAPTPPIEILRRRLAAGEISVEEFEERKRVLDLPRSDR